MQLYLGECQTHLPKFADSSVELIVTDLPYGEVEQKSSGLRKLDRGNADRCDIDLGWCVDQMVRVCSGSFYVFCGTEQISKIVSAFKSYGLTTRVGAWEKSNPSPMNGTKLWLSGLEFCVFARKAKATFNEHCQKALWRSASGRSKIHPTEKPVALMQRLIEASSNPGDTVLDFCAGSGSTGVAALQSGRQFIGIERELEYWLIAHERCMAVRV